MSDANQAVDGQEAPLGPQMNLSLVPREPRFVVRLPGRIPRTGSLPVQLALPRLFHQRLRVGTSGSLNHALIALVRQAFAWLDADRVSLRIHAGRDPLTTKSQRPGLAEDAKDAALEAPAHWQLPHAMFEPIPRDAQVLVEVRGRPSRQDIVYIQVGLPADIQGRLQEQGLGSISQLVAYLARYAYMRLQMEGLSLHVAVEHRKEEGRPQVVFQPSLSRALDTRPGANPIATVGELIEQLQQFPHDTPVGLTDQNSGAESQIIGLEIDRSPTSTGTLMLLGDLDDGLGSVPYEEDT